MKKQIKRLGILASVFSAANGIDFGICVPGCFFEGGQWGKGLDLGEF